MEANISQLPSFQIYSRGEKLATTAEVSDLFEMVANRPKDVKEAPTAEVGKLFKMPSGLVKVVRKDIAITSTII
jgi:hypothetical protein